MIKTLIEITKLAVLAVGALAIGLLVFVIVNNVLVMAL